MSGRGVWMGVAAAAAAVTFVVGFGLGARQSGTKGEAMSENATRAAESTAAPAADLHPKFAVFLFENESYRPAAPDRAMERVKEYGAWARGLAESGRYVTGEKLADDGRFCRLENGELAASGPQADEKRGTLTGYFVIGAASLDEAMEVAKTCPHLAYGGTVEIRQLES